MLGSELKEKLRMFQRTILFSSNMRKFAWKKSGAWRIRRHVCYCKYALVGEYILQDSSEIHQFD